MATALTEAQREAKRARDRAYRANKKASVPNVVAEKLKEVEIVGDEVIPSESFGPVVTETGSPSAETLDILGLVPAEIPEKFRTLFAKTLEADLAKLKERGIEVDRAFAEQRAQVILWKSVILRAPKGTEVQFPGNLGAYGYVAYVHRDTGRLVTADGLSKTGGMCEHPDSETSTDGVYYEYVGGAWAGEHGWIHGDLKCRKPYQVG